MPNVHGTKWGDPTLGTPGGTVTWSVADGNKLITDFFTSPFDHRGQLWRSVDPDSFLNFDYQSVIAEAFAEWSKYGNIEFQQVTDGGGSAGSPSSGGDIRIFFARLPGNTLGLGAFPEPTLDVRGDIVLDVRGLYNFNRAIFKGLVLHEIGHALGLGHVSSDSVLTPVISKTSLQRDDRDGIREIYGVQDDAEPTYDVRGAGPIQLQAKNNDLVALGSNGGNNINGTNGDDTIDGAGGADKLKGRDGADELRGGDGDDKLVGGAGADTLIGGNDYDTADYRSSKLGIVLDMLAASGTGGDAAGDTLTEIERIIGSQRSDTIQGDNDANRFDGQNGSDWLEGRGGNDLLRGQGGQDTLIGDEGDDTLEGGGGGDRLIGGADQDLLKGNGGDDDLLGNDGDDELRGGSGKDELTGGGGDDILNGGLNADRFIFSENHGNDTIQDFNTRSGSEVIVLDEITDLDDFQAVLAASSQTDDGVLINTGASSSILLEGVRLNNLSEDDFEFPAPPSGFSGEFLV